MGLNPENGKNIDLVLLGKVMQTIRKKHQMTQEQLHTFSKIDRSYISEIETGLKSPTFHTLLTWCKVFRIKPSQLMIEFEKEMKNYENNK